MDDLHTNIKMNPEEAAAYLDVEPSTLATWRSKNIGPVYYKPGGNSKKASVYYFKNDLDDYIKSGKIQTKAV